MENKTGGWRDFGRFGGGGVLELGKKENWKVGEHMERNVRKPRTDSEGLGRSSERP